MIQSGDMTTNYSNYKIVLLAGGVGGAKLAAGVAALVPPEQLTIIVNTGDDFQHLGLTICPDLDTVMYTLAGVSNSETGWGRAGESWRTIAEVGRLGGPDWFRLGDLDLATHLSRTHWLQNGETLTAVTRRLCQKLNIQPTVLPMSDQSAPTMIETETGVLPFQTWFVQEQWQPTAAAIQFPDDARAASAATRAMQAADLVLIAPSNPFVSVDPILNCYPLRPMIEDLPRAVVAVSPIVGGTAVKGPLAKMMQERSLPVTPRAVADYYGDLIDGFVFDERDAGAMDGYEGTAVAADTLMTDADSRRRVAQVVLDLAVEIGGG